MRNLSKPKARYSFVQFVLDSRGRLTGKVVLQSLERHTKETRPIPELSIKLWCHSDEKYRTKNAPPP